MTPELASQFRSALGVASIAVPLVGGGLWNKSASVQVRDSMDDFIGDLHRQGRWNSRAAIASAVAAAS